MYFLSTHLPIQITSFLILLPATQISTYLGNAAACRKRWAACRGWCSSSWRCWWRTSCEYWIHRAFHQVPFLWGFHAIHHSSKALDWIAGSRAHLVEDVLVRGGMLIPMMFVVPADIIVAYLFLVTIHATWAHCNFRPTIKWLEPFLVQPRFHHWHHTAQQESIDKNFAIHFPWIDRIFGTYYFPKDGSWPETYGLHEEKLPSGFWAQFFYPFRRRKAG